MDSLIGTNLAIKVNMKKLALLLLCLSGCGSDNQHASPSPSPEAVIVAIPTPIPQEPVVGNWIDSKQNILQINNDHTVLLGQESLNWATQGNSIIFSSHQTEIDTCLYQIKLSGKLGSVFDILLNLFCDKSGNLSYKKND